MLDDSNISVTVPEFGISVVVIKRMSLCLGKNGHVALTDIVVVVVVVVIERETNKCGKC